MPGKLLILAISVVSILLLQATGLHLHADGVEVGSLHGEHHHFVGDDDHDHAGDADVSLFELGVVWAKLLAMLAPILLIFAMPALLSGRAPFSFTPTSRRTRRLRWRPLLRAPPALI